MTAEPARAESERAAMQAALGRIRYLAKDLTEVADVLDVMDKELADALSIPVDEVAKATGTAPIASDRERAMDGLLSRAKLVSALTDDDRSELSEARELAIRTVWQRVTELVARGELDTATQVLQHSGCITVGRVEVYLTTLAHCLEAAEFRRNPPTRT